MSTNTKNNQESIATVSYVTKQAVFGDGSKDLENTTYPEIITHSYGMKYPFTVKNQRYHAIRDFKVQGREDWDSIIEDVFLFSKEQDPMIDSFSFRLYTLDQEESNEADGLFVSVEQHDTPQTTVKFHEPVSPQKAKKVINEKLTEYTKDLEPKEYFFDLTLNYTWSN